MKKIIILVAITLVTLPAYAQQHDKKETNNKKHHTEMIHESSMHKEMMQICMHHMMKNNMDLKPDHAIHQNQMKNKSCPMNKHANNKQSPYVGQQNREIKALSAQQVAGYLKGRGMGFSKVAELNHYPGPKHIMALSKKLNLSKEQYKKVTEAFKAMKKKAQNLGKHLIEKERQLDKLFAKKKAAKAEVEELIREIGKLRAKIRFTHVSAHMKMEKILTPLQVKKYDKLRGYPNGANNQMHHNQHHST